jgi:phage shock protein A
MALLIQADGSVKRINRTSLTEKQQLAETGLALRKELRELRAMVFTLQKQVKELQEK